MSKEIWQELQDGNVKHVASGKVRPREAIQAQIDDGRIQLDPVDPDEKKPIALRAKRAEINDHRDGLIEDDYQQGGRTFEANDTSVRNMKEKLLEIAILDQNANVVWIDKNDDPVPMTHGTFKAMLLAIGRRKDAAYLRANVLKTSLNSMTLAEIEAFDVASEW